MRIATFSTTWYFRVIFNRRSLWQHRCPYLGVVDSGSEMAARVGKIVAPTMVALMAVASVGIVLIPLYSNYAMNISGKLCIVIPAFAGIH